MLLMHKDLWNNKFKLGDYGDEFSLINRAILNIIIIISFHDQ